ncbi:hypothetical protein EGR_09224 [Echinococcus granulosus]|uniref:Uncharacterized protein n=1 Tax=Echinococcus granulosus TaxID=6210 RepID=W6U471_ECHGR|nr:hypothetical protein EGR_09224 [Echinococcus granulosus]EUB55910.1 hypothetical protein EGR_09224 [Echinococcus granulosus]
MSPTLHLIRISFLLTPTPFDGSGSSVGGTIITAMRHFPPPVTTHNSEGRLDMTGNDTGVDTGLESFHCRSWRHNCMPGGATRAEGSSWNSRNGSPGDFDVSVIDHHALESCIDHHVCLTNFFICRQKKFIELQQHRCSHMPASLSASVSVSTSPFVIKSEPGLLPRSPWPVASGNASLHCMHDGNVVMPTARSEEGEEDDNDDDDDKRGASFKCSHYLLSQDHMWQEVSKEVESTTDAANSAARW